MVWLLVPLHVPNEKTTALPVEGSVTVGRRPTNGIVCKDLAVSGVHCIVYGHGAGAGDLPEVEDCSTNGTYVNGAKLDKGVRNRLNGGDLLSLTKELEPDAASDCPPRVQFRLEHRDCTSQEAGAAEVAAPAEAAPSAQPGAQQQEIAATAADRAVSIAGRERSDRVPSPVAAVDLGAAANGITGGGGATGAGLESNFAQDLLVQEQQSKAKITGELLHAQRKLEDERRTADSLTRELQKLRQQVEEERSRRHEVEENRDKLANEAEVLKAERRSLQELTSAHEELKQRHEATESELRARLRRCTELEAAQEQLRKEVESATAAHQKASQQHAELLTRVRQTQERAERLEQQHIEAQRDADRALEEGSRLQRELSAEKAAREQLEQEVSETREQVSAAEASERAAREALDAATARRAELECRASAALSDAEGARAAARQAKQRLGSTAQQVERLREAGRGLSTEFRRRADIWDKALSEGRFDALEEMLAASGPTFAQVTVQMEDTPAVRAPPPGRQPPTPLAEDTALAPPTAASATAQQKHLPGGIAKNEEAELPATGAAAATTGAAARPEQRPHEPGTPPPPPQGVQNVEDSVSPVPPAADGGGSGRRELDGGAAGMELTPRALFAGTDAGAVKPPPVADSDAGVDRHMLRSGALLAEAHGCSTAWSLELLEVIDNPLPPSKRQRLAGD